MTQNADYAWPVGRYVGGYGRTDPRHVLAERLCHENADGWVMVKASEIRAVHEMRVCRATEVFERDEDGPMPPMTAHCVKEAGHPYDHGNGYYTWSAAEQ